MRCYPIKQNQLSEDWYSAYINTYLARDVRSLANIGDLRDFHRLIQLLAANTAQILNMSRFASDIGVDVKTIKRWISILEASYIVFLLPPFHKNYGKRVVKRPKLYFYDTGLVAHLSGIKNKQRYLQGPMSGALFENYVIGEILKQQLHRKTHTELYYLRTAKGEEVDLILDDKQAQTFIEIKSSETFTPKMTAILEKFAQANDKQYRLYKGKPIDYLRSVQVLNYHAYLSDAN